MGGHAQCLQPRSSWIAVMVTDNGSEGSVGKLKRRGRERQEEHPLAGESALSQTVSSLASATGEEVISREKALAALTGKCRTS